MFDLVQYFIDLVSKITSLVDLEAALDAVTRDLGFDFYALMEHVDLTHRRSGKILALSSYPADWIDIYVAEKIVSHDPILLASHQTHIGFKWDRVGDYIPVNSVHRRIRERTQRAGILDGFTVPVHIPGQCHGSCNFALAKPRILRPEVFHAAQLIGAFAFEAGRRILQASLRSPTPPRLTPRMIDCAALVALGKTDFEAGTILGIAEDTVSEYLDEARRRYDVVTRTQLLIQVLFDGYLGMSDYVRRSPP